jgi:phosphatidylglycerophosphatase A
MEFIATGFYSGKLPKMPGTWGSILGALLLYLFWPNSVYLQAVIVAVTFALSVITSDYLAKNLKEKDPEQVVIDEILGMELTFLALNPSGNLKLTIAGLILFRTIDIMKPFPIRLFERLPGGWGITVDDAVAGIMSNLLLRLLGGFL